MKRGLIFLLWISAVFAYGQPAPASSNHADDERAIRRLNEEVLKAYNLGDVKTLDRVEGADFTLTGDFGEVPKQQQLDAPYYVMKHCANSDVSKLTVQLQSSYELQE